MALKGLRGRTRFVQMFEPPFDIGLGQPG